MVNSNNVTRKFTMKEKLASLGPGFVIVGSFIGPGTVTSCTLAGATYGFTLFWCVVFSVIAVIVMQGMAARIGIITQEGLAENMKHDFADRPLLRNILCGLVIIAITIGGLAYMGGDLTGTAMGASALTGVPTRIMAPILGVIVLIVLLFVGDAVKYLEKLLSVCVTLMAIVFLMTMLIVRPDFGELLRGCIPTVPKGGLMTCLSLIGTTVVPYNMFLHAASAQRTWHTKEELPLCMFGTTVPMIIGEIRRYLRDNSAMRVSRSLRDTAYRALQAKEAFIREHQREPDIVELAKLMDVPKEVVVFALDAILDPVSLFEPVFHDGTDTVCVMDQVGDTKNTDDNWLAGIALRDAMRSLNDRERRIIRLRFFEGRTQMEVAREIHLSPNKRKEDSDPFLTINVRAAENARIAYQNDIR